MFNKCGLATLVGMVALLFVTESLFAQPGGGRGFGGRGRGGIIGLIGNEAVQKDLGLGDQEKEKLTQLAQAHFGEMREQMQAAGVGDLQNATAEERQKIFAKMQETTQKLTDKYVPSIKDALKPEQFTRLQQISWQASGSSAFNDPDLVKALEVSKEQQEKLTALNQEYQQKQAALFRGEGGRETFAKLRELGQERDQKAEEILSKEQQEKFTELKGKPFDLAQLQQGGPGGGRPGAGRKGGDKKE